MRKKDLVLRHRVLSYERVFFKVALRKKDGLRLSKKLEAKGRENS